MDSKTKNTSSWLVILTLVFFVWPLGLYLMYRKVKNDKIASLKNSMWLRKFGIFWTGLGVLLLGSLVVEGTENVFWPAVVLAFFVFIVGGIAMLQSSGKLQQQGVMYKQYIEIVVNQQVRKISEISKQVGKDRELVIKQLQQMIDVGFFKNAEIDFQVYEIILNGTQKQKVPLQNTKENKKQDATGMSASQAQEQQQRVVVCNGCGAKNVVTVNRICYCEYCDSPLEG